MALLLIWGVVLTAYSIARLAEWRLHRRNYQILRAAGAEERIPRLMQLYYIIHVLIIPAAVYEQWALGAEVTGVMLVSGLMALFGGQALRLWAISSLGPLWSMRCLGLPGLRHRRLGPYRFIENPEYFSRLIDGIGLGVLFGAKLTLCAYLLLVLVLNRRLAAAEQAQIADLHADAPRPLHAQPPASRVA